MRYKSSIYLKRTIAFGLYTGIAYLVFELLDGLAMLKFVEYDYIPYINANSMYYVLIVMLIVLMAWSIKDTTLSLSYSYLKHNGSMLMGTFFVMEVLTFAKIVSIPKLLLPYVILFYLYWILLQSILNKTFRYEMPDYENGLSHFSEKPVVGRKNLTKPQIEALDCLIDTIDHRTSTDSINIALLGEWGSGKTSITNTLVKELQLRDLDQSGKSLYFILIINAQVLINSKSIVEYIKKYFSQLFREYGISILSGKSGVAFLSLMAEMIEGAKPITALQSVSGNATEYFIDIEQERTVFAKNVHELLKTSKRKNILFIIDNIDRLDNNKQLLHMSSEFASISGIITIFSLDPYKGYTFKIERNEPDDSTMNTGEHSEISSYDELDKYIHTVIRIPELDKIEYEQGITEQILRAVDNPVATTNKQYYVRVDKIYDYSLFSNKEFIINVEQSDNNTITGCKHSILTDLFFYGLEKMRISFGEYFERLVINHFCESKEVSKFIYLDNEGNISYSLVKVQILAQWTNLLYEENWTWTENWLFNIENFVVVFSCIQNGLSRLINSTQEEIAVKIENIKDVHKYEVVRDLTDPAWSIDENTTEYWPLLPEITELLLSNADADTINSYIASGKYQLALDCLLKYKDRIIDYYLNTVVLIDFVKYLRESIHNYRCFKMQLRECELLHTNYLEYLVDHWSISKKMDERVRNNLRLLNALNESENPYYPSVSRIIDNLLFENFVLDYGKNVSEKELLNCKLYLFHDGTDAKIIVKNGIDGKDMTIMPRLFINHYEELNMQTLFNCEQMEADGR